MQNRLKAHATKRSLAPVLRAVGSLGLRAHLRLTRSKASSDGQTGPKRYRYVARLALFGHASRPAEEVRQALEQAGGKKGWSLQRLRSQEPGAAPAPALLRRPFVAPPLTDEVLATYFKGVYERDEHIRTIHAAVEVMAQTGGAKTYHCLLRGDPAACKSKLMGCIKAWYESVNGPGCVQTADATTMTKAGLERWLLDLAEIGRLPDVLVVDEIEKQPIDNILCLNAVMGSGVLTRMNANIGNVQVPARFLVVGICNDEEQLRKFRSGAIWSRFSHELYCPRPSRELCLKILLGEVGEMGGDPAWAQAALAFGWDVLGQRDIRKIKAHLTGRGRLLDGTWQRGRLAILEAEQRDREAKEREHRLGEARIAGAIADARWEEVVAGEIDT